MREATIATSLVIDFLSYLERRGHTRTDICRAAALDPAVTDVPDSRVAASAMERLWAVGERLTGDTDIGMHTAESYNPGALSIFGYVILSCRTAGDVLDRLARYAPLLNEALQVELIQEPEAVHCRFLPVERLDSYLLRAPRQAMETLAAGCVLTLQRLTTEPVEPVFVSFRHRAPGAVGEHRRLFGPRVQFDAPYDSVVFRPSALTARIISADPALLGIFEGDADRRLKELALRGAVSGRVLSVLGERLKGEVPPLGLVASELAMSERSVQRSLREEETSYRELVDEVRRDLALRHLARPGTSATDVAFLLGFSEPSAFTRAFRRWTGQPPAQFRAALAG